MHISLIVLLSLIQLVSPHVFDSRPDCRRSDVFCMDVTEGDVSYDGDSIILPDFSITLWRTNATCELWWILDMNRYLGKATFVVSANENPVRIVLSNTDKLDLSLMEGNPDNVSDLHPHAKSGLIFNESAVQGNSSGPTHRVFGISFQTGEAFCKMWKLECGVSFHVNAHLIAKETSYQVLSKPVYLFGNQTTCSGHRSSLSLALLTLLSMVLLHA